MPGQVNGDRYAPVDIGMTKFKELRRIQRAIENQDVMDLEWAANYCRTRIKIATKKDHAKYWRNILRDVESAISSAGA